MKKICDKKAQQEIVGFVLIVVIVVVALMVFLILSVRQPVGKRESVVVENLLSAVMETTTECVVSEPFYDNMRDLIKDCHERRRCTNFDVLSCDYLNATISGVMNDLVKTDNSIGSYELVAFLESEESPRPVVAVSGGVCNRSSSGIYTAQDRIRTFDGDIAVRLEICSN